VLFRSARRQGGQAKAATEDASERTRMSVSERPEGAAFA